MSWLARLLLSPPRCRDPRSLRAALSGRTVLITGASYGIGEATARLFARAGAEVLLLARTEGRLRQIEQHIRAAGGRAHAYPLDLSRPDEVAAVAERVQRAHPRIDVVISNAGKSIRRSALRSAERDDLGRSLAVNFTGPAALLLALLPRMVAQGGGQVISVSTVSAKPPAAPRWGSYQGSKAGFDVWLRALAVEVRTRDVRVTSVYLPLVRTRMSDGTRLYRRLPALHVDDAALVLAEAVVRPRDRVAPWWLRVQELVAVLFPGRLDRVLGAVEALEQRFTGPRRS